MKYINTLFFCSIIFWSFNQETYKTAIGIKGGYPSYGSLNIKHRLNNFNAIEASVGGSAIGVSSSGIIIEALYEINKPLKEKGLEWFYGGGVISGYIKKRQTGSDVISNSFLIGVKSNIGIEYTFEDFPLNVSLDTGPVMLFTPYLLFSWGGGLALRYTVFNK